MEAIVNSNAPCQGELHEVEPDKKKPALAFGKNAAPCDTYQLNQHSNRSHTHTTPLLLREPGSVQINSENHIPDASRDSPQTVKNKFALSDSTSIVNSNGAPESNIEQSNSLNELKTILADIDVPEAFKQDPIKYIFSPELDKRHWQQQLESLKACNAEICGIRMTGFTTVDVIDLSNIGDCEVKMLTGKKRKH